MNLKKGFSLIETIVVVSIIALFTGIGITKFNDFSEEKRLDTEVKDLVDALDSARAKTVAQELSGVNTASCNFEGYTLRIDSTAKKYTLQVRCPEIVTTNFSHTFPTAIQITPAGITSVQYKYPEGFTTNTTNVTLTLKHLTLGKCVDLIIMPSGLINESEKRSC
jgi:prepilin-type N-terminal cleavage/methylation domain-containing protein